MIKGEKDILTPEEIRALPKVELHVHLDCCLSFDVVSQLRPAITLEEYQQEFIAPPKCKNLADFLERIDSSLALMQNETSLRMVTEDLFRQLWQDNIMYAEIRFAPLLHLNEGLTPDEVVTIVEKAVTRMVEETGIKTRLILCALRHFKERESLRTAELVEDFRGTRVVAMDLAADEAGSPLDAHVKAFEFLRHRFIPFTVHAGEAKGPESVRETLERLDPSRIGHGVRSIEDPRLIKLLKKKNIHLEVCPSCNVQIDIYDSYEDHPIDRLYRQGVSVGINTDTRTLTNISLTDEYKWLHRVFGWGKQDFLRCNQNALDAAFLPDCMKERLKTRLSEEYGDIGRLE
jgi:adenosine deaminase